MKTNIKLLAIAGLFGLAVVSCKKDKDADPNPGPGTDTPGAYKVVKIDSLKSLYSNTAITLESNIMIKGIVISDLANGNIDSREVVVQEGDNKAGILLKLNAITHSFKLGDVVEVRLSNQKLDTLSGELAIKNLAADSIKKTGTGIINPRKATVKQVKDNAKAWNGTLVTIENGLFTNNEIFLPAADYTDATGTLTTKTLPTASFAVKPIPYQKATLTGIVRLHDDVVSVDMCSWYITFLDVTDYKAPYTITEDFQLSPTGSGMTINPTLKTGAWHYNVTGVYPESAIQDGSYSTRNKIVRLERNGAYLNIPMLKGLKTITVEFAGSLTDTVNAYVGSEVVPFNANRDDVSVKINTSYYAGMIESPSYTIKELGKFHTVTFLVKKDDFATMDIDLDNGGDILRVENASSLTRKNMGTPVVINKVIFGFDQKDPSINAALWDN